MTNLSLTCKQSSDADKRVKRKGKEVPMSQCSQNQRSNKQTFLCVCEHLGVFTHNAFLRTFLVPMLTALHAFSSSLLEILFKHHTVRRSIRLLVQSCLRSALICFAIINCDTSRSLLFHVICSLVNNVRYAYFVWYEGFF